MLAPIVLFVYNRADHFQKTFEALSKCPEASDSELFIFSDGPKNESAAPKVQKVRKALHAVETSGFFKSITIYESPVNKGLASSIISGVTNIMERFGRAIVLEDDCQASPNFLSFMNRCLDAFENNPQIGSIAGYAPPIDFPKDYTNDTFLAWRSCSWGWATWKDRWQDVDWELKEIADFYQNPELLKRLNANGSDRFIRLHRQTKGNGSSWSVRFGAHLVRKGLYTLYPRFSYIQNIGCDESGVHSKQDDADNIRVDLEKAIHNPNLDLPPYNEPLQRILCKYYSGGFWSSLKRKLGTQWIIARERLKL